MNTRQAWVFKPYTLKFRGRNNVPEWFLCGAEWRGHQGSFGYYTYSSILPDWPIAVEFNHEHLCWVELQFHRNYNNWMAFRIARPDLGLSIPCGNLTTEETDQILGEEWPSEISDSEGPQGDVLFSPPTCHKSANQPPSHGGTYVVKGCLSLGSDWLIIASEPCLFSSVHTSPRIVTVRRILLFSRVSGLRKWPLSLLSSLSWYAVLHSVRLHGVLYPMTDLPTYGLMTLSADAPRCSITFHST